MKKKKIVILGGGESGVGTAILAQKEQFEVFVSDLGVIADKYKTVLDLYKISYEEKNHTLDKILDADIVMKSPGIPEKAGIVVKIKDRNIPIVSELEFAYPYQKGKIIGITGSNGKTTTTSLIYHIFKIANLNVGMAGNIGKSFAEMVANDPKDIYILEISSFQLDNIKHFHCDVAILLNITPDHLDRYEYDLQNYVKSKFNIALNQTDKDSFIYCVDDEETMKYLDTNATSIPSQKFPISIQKENISGGYLSNNQLIINSSEPIFTMQTQELTIKGKHNFYNSLAAGVAAKAFDIKNDVLREAFQTFQSIPHRMEKVISLHDVEYINDSKATNVNSTWYALESMEKKTVWIVGGIDKGNDYSVLKPLIKEKVKAIVCLGLDNIKIHEEFKGLIDVMISVDNMKDAVKSASRLAAKNEVVLLSPSCASFDLFENYEDRGNQFKQYVREL